MLLKINIQGYNEEDEDISLQVFKSLFEEELNEFPQNMIINGDRDATIKRFLRARKYEPDDTMSMIKSKIN